MTYNEGLGSYTAGTSPWALTNVPSAGSLSSISVSGSVVTLNLTEGAGAADTALGKLQGRIHRAGLGRHRRQRGKQRSFLRGHSAPGQGRTGADPLQRFDTDADGKVNQVKATFSREPRLLLRRQRSMDAREHPERRVPFVGIDLQPGRDAHDHRRSGRSGHLGRVLHGRARNERHRDPRLQREPSSFVAQAPGDKAGPVPVGLTDTNGATDGLFEAADTMTLTFSESVTGISASSNVVITDKAGSSSNDGVTMSNLLAGTANLSRRTTSPATARASTAACCRSPRRTR